MEGLIFITGSIVAFAIVRLRQKWECYQKDWIMKKNKELQDKNEKLAAENAMLSSPKRLVSEFRGDEGSGVGELLKTMQKKVDDLADTTEKLQNEKSELQQSNAKLERERDSLKSEYDNKLKEAYLGAIDELERMVASAMKGGSLDKKKAVDKLKQKSEELKQDEKASDDGLFPARKDI